MNTRQKMMEPSNAITQRLRDYLDDSGLKWKESKTSYIFDCPRCRKAEKLWMFRDSGRFVCWHCAEIDGFKGRPEYALAEMLGLPVRSIQRDLYKGESPTVEAFFDFRLTDWWGNDESFDAVPDMATTPSILWGPDCLPIDHPLSRAGAEYLRSRGISLELARRYNIHYSGPQQRVLFPVEYRGRCFGWQARLVTESEYCDEEGRQRSIPKVLTVEGLRKDQVLMFADRLSGSRQVILCEGPVDALKCHLCSVEGEPSGNVATMGKAVSPAQLSLVRYSGASRVYLALDPDAAAETERIVRDLQEHMEVYLMEVPPPYKDFGEMPLEEVRECWLGAKRALPGRIYVYLKRHPQLFGPRTQP